MTRAFIAGATGYTGQALVAEWTRRGHEAVAHIRPASSSLEARRKEFEALGASVDTSPWEQAAMRAAIRTHAPDVVFALLGTTKKRGRAAAERGEREDYETIDYGLSKMLLDATVAESEARFVYLSSMGVTAKTSNAYLAVRHRLETDLRESGLPFVIARPSFITGDREESRPGEKAGAVVVDALLGVARVFGAKKTAAKYESQTASELASALATLALEPKPAGVVESDGLRARA